MPTNFHPLVVPGNPGPSPDGIKVTPSDSDDLPYIARRLYVGVGGDLRVLTSTGTDLFFQNVQDGSILPLSVKRVMLTNTEAQDIVALY